MNLRVLKLPLLRADCVTVYGIHASPPAAARAGPPARAPAGLTYRTDFPVLTCPARAAGAARGTGAEGFAAHSGHLDAVT